MNIKVDWNKVIEVEPSIEKNLYFIAIVFQDATMCTLGYANHKQFIKDYTKIMEEWR